MRSPFGSSSVPAPIAILAQSSARQKSAAPHREQLPRLARYSERGLRRQTTSPSTL
jgi:hypothetical protein